LSEDPRDLVCASEVSAAGLSFSSSHDYNENEVFEEFKEEDAFGKLQGDEVLHCVLMGLN
jgi:hypothetical protein